MGPGGRHEVPTETACGGPAEHSIPPGITNAESVVFVPKQMPNLEKQLGQQAVVQRGNQTTKKIRRLKAEKAIGRSSAP